MDEILEEALDRGLANSQGIYEPPEELTERILAEHREDILGLGVPTLRHVLGGLPESQLNEFLQEEVLEAASRIGSRPSRGRAFGMSTDFPGEPEGFWVDGFSEVYVEVPEWLVEEEGSEQILEELRGKTGDHWRWEELDDGEYLGVITDSMYYLYATRDMEEGATDFRREWLSDMVEDDPAQAVNLMMQTIKKDQPDLHRSIKKAKMPASVMRSYAVAYFDNQEDGLELLTEAMGRFGYEGSRGEELERITRNDLRSLGITSGKWWDGAPWTLLNLPPNELAYEGVLMRHCVGRHDMGYREAVEDEETYIWSLRSAFNKPVVTFEVDREAWDFTGRRPELLKGERGAAIIQMKKKLNRKPPESAQERAVLEFLLEQLDVDPASVDDWQPRARNPRRRRRPMR